MDSIKGYGDLEVRDRWDRIFKQLSHTTRRQLILTLAREPPDTWIALPEEFESPPVDHSDEKLAISLHHQHLPMLADDGYVKWRPTPLAAMQGPRFDELAALLETLIAQAESLPNHLVYGCDILEKPQG